MRLIKIDLSTTSKITCNFSISTDHSILFAEIEGEYRDGTSGNPDGVYIFGLLASYYFAFEPISIVLDLRNLEYSWGNTISKCINFFNEIGRDQDEKNKTNIIIYSSINKKALQKLNENFIEGNRMFFEDDEEALKFAVSYVNDFLNP